MTPSERAAAMATKTAKAAEVRRLFGVISADWPADEKRDGLAWALADPDGAVAAPRGLGASSGQYFEGSDRLLRVDLGPDAKLQATLSPDARWPRQFVGGSSLFQSVPALNQYWHPWLLGGRATGTAIASCTTGSVNGAEHENTGIYIRG